MDTLAIILISSVGFVIAYNTYGRFLAKKIFQINPNASVPSHERNDGIDYVPSKRGIIFGHHFTSIAGTGPIVGPAIGIIWGWVPALLWVLLGSIFIGAVHDFGSLIVSLRNDGVSISEVAARYINVRVRIIFFCIVFLVLLIVIAIFGMVIAIVFARFPSAVPAVWLQIPIAVALGWAVYKKNMSVIICTALAVVAMYCCVAAGAWIEQLKPGLFTIDEIAGIPATGVWTIVLLIYAWIASTLPVTVLLQPRDYINAWQLFIMMFLLAAGVIWAGLTGDLQMVAPAANFAPAGAPPIWPFLFVTIACGAVSGFHSLVASGTSPKQIANERDAQFIGYGAMITEGALAVLVLICVGAGLGIAYQSQGGQLLTGKAAFAAHYSSWTAAKGLGSKLTAVVVGAANIINSMKLSHAFGITVMGVFIASFAGTTLDTAVRLQRYIVSELFGDIKLKFLANRYIATTFAAATAAVLAFATGADGKGALKLWPLFGAANQLLAALALLVVSMYLKRKGGLKFIFTAIPAVIMLIITFWAAVINEISFYKQGNWLLVTIGGILLFLAAWMVVETLVLFTAKKQL